MLRSIKRFCDTITPGFYLSENKSGSIKRCVYASGTTKGNYWIELVAHEPRWNSLLWNCIDKDCIFNATYSETNPTEFELVMKKKK